MNDNIYSAPSSQLSNTPATGQYGSLERGINGDYEVAIGAILSEAWAKTKGAKWTFQLALTYYFVIYILLSIALTFIFTGHFSMGEAAPTSGAIMTTLAKSQLQTLLIMAIVAPLNAGLFMLGLRRAADAAISAGSIFNYFSQFATLAVTGVLVYLAIVVGMFLLIIPGVYLSIALMFATPLVADKKLGAMAALKTSRAALSKHWFAIFGFYLVLGLINIAMIFTLGIGLIWTIPMSMIASGILYRNIFGCEAETLAD